MSIVKSFKFEAGFTLLELLLVIAIIAVLAGIILFALNPAQRLQEANVAKAASNAQDLQKALNTYVLEIMQDNIQLRSKLYLQQDIQE